VPRLAENLPYFGKHMDLSIAYNMEEGTMETIQFEYLNWIAAYMLHALTESQSMGKLCMLSKMFRTWRSSWRKTLMLREGLSQS
jgi:hypothetical protein